MEPDRKGGSAIERRNRVWLEDAKKEWRGGVGAWCRALVRGASLLLVVGLPGLASAAAEVSLQIENPPSPVLPGQEVLYHLRVANRSATAATGELELEANIPEFMSVTRERLGKCAPNSCYYAKEEGRYGSVVRWSLASLAPGESAERVLRAVVDSTAPHPFPAAGTQIALEAIVKAGATKVAGGSSTVSADVSAPALELSVTGPARAEPNREVEYRLRYGNRSSAAASGLLRMPIPTGTRVLLASQGAVQRGAAIEWDVDTLPAGRSDFRALRLEVDATVRAGTFLAIQPELQARGNKIASRASTSTYVGPRSDLNLTLTAAPDPAAPGGAVVVKLEVTNESPGAATGAFEVFASIPQHASVSQQRGPVCVPFECYYSKSFARRSSLVSWKVESLAPGQTVPLQYSAVIDQPATAAPPPNGSTLSIAAFTSAKGARATRDLVLGSPDSAGTGLPLVALGAAPQRPVATPAASPPSPPPAPTPVVATTDTEPEPDVAAIPDAEVEEQFQPDEDEAKVPAAEQEKRRKWRKGDWDKYCEGRWRSGHWDRHCAKRWWQRRDWDQYCKIEARRHHGWKKYCARDFRHWRFAREPHHDPKRKPRDRDQPSRRGNGK